MRVLHFLLVDFGEGYLLLVIVTGEKQSLLLLRPTEVQFGVEFDNNKGWDIVFKVVFKFDVVFIFEIVLIF